MEFLITILLVALVVAIAIWLFIARQGDAEFEFLVDERTDFALEELTEKTATFSCKVPFINKGTQGGTIMDAYPRHLLPHEQFDGVEVSSRLELLSAPPRTDNYFESVIILAGEGDTVVVTVKFTAKEGGIEEALGQMAELTVDMAIDIVYQIVARTPWYIHKTRMIMKCTEIMNAMQTKSAAK